MSSMKHDKFATWKICLKEINKPYTRCQYHVDYKQHNYYKLHIYVCAIMLECISKNIFSLLPYKKLNNTRKNLQVVVECNERNVGVTNKLYHAVHITCPKNYYYTYVIDNFRPPKCTFNIIIVYKEFDSMRKHLNFSRNQLQSEVVGILL